jgi:hypothetical protein
MVESLCRSAAWDVSEIEKIFPKFDFFYASAIRIWNFDTGDLLESVVAGSRQRCSEQNCPCVSENNLAPTICNPSSKELHGECISNYLCE